MPLPLKRLEAKTTKELLWLYVLKLLQKRSMYAYEIRAEVAKKFGWKPPLVTSYTVLYRLKRKGYVKAEWQQQTRKPSRNYYKITPKGRKLMRDAKRYMSDLQKRLFK